MSRAINRRHVREFDGIDMYQMGPANPWTPEELDALANAGDFADFIDEHEAWKRAGKPDLPDWYQAKRNAGMDPLSWSIGTKLSAFDKTKGTTR